MFGNDFENLALLIKQIPGISKKQAERIIHYLIEIPANEIEDFVTKLLSLKQNMIFCKRCNFLSENSTCHICIDLDRSHKVLVVETSEIVTKFEATDKYNGRYFVLGDYNIKKLELLEPKIEQLKAMISPKTEIILGISSTLNGLIVSSHISQHPAFANNKISQLATGIPFGASIEYMDGITLEQAINNRKENSK